MRRIRLEWHSNFDDLMFQQYVDIENQEALTELTKRYLMWNRLDLYKKLRAAVAAAMANDRAKGITTAVKDVPPIDSAVIDPNRAIGGHQKEPGGVPFHPHPHYVSSYEKNLVFHRHSVIAFLKGLAGHAFCGAVMLSTGRDLVRERAPETPEPQSKIYLLPVQPNFVNRANGRGPASYATRPHDARKLTRIYRNALNPTTHLRSDSTGATIASHLTLVDEGIYSKNIYSAVPKGNGEVAGAGRFVGFTVQKGDIETGLPNRYAMTSQTLNGGTFGNHILVNGQRVSVYWPSREWVNSIIEACDALLDVEAFLMERYHGRLGTAIGVLGLGPARTNQLWQDVKKMFWPPIYRPRPIGGTSVFDRARQQEASTSEDEDEWLL